jgi:PBP1b-binding outer membrane lipoprotein LpoB
MEKRILTLIAALVLGTCLQATAGTAKEEKDQCLLASKNCVTQVDTIQKRMKRINTEIKKGTKVYSPEELAKLNNKLKEADDILKELEAK